MWKMWYFVWKRIVKGTKFKFSVEISCIFFKKQIPLRETRVDVSSECSLRKLGMNAKNKTTKEMTQQVFLSFSFLIVAIQSRKTTFQKRIGIFEFSVELFRKDFDIFAV
jgi:hypothetical protein